VNAYRIIVDEDEYTTGGPCFVARHPELLGCLSQGQTIREALANLADARQMWLEHAREHQLPMPAPTSPWFIDIRINFEEGWVQ
jgi:antitoxin HicB